MGFLEVIVGNPGTGKSWHGRRLLRDQIAPGRLCIYHSPNADDRFEFGPPLSARELVRGGKVPRAFQLVHCSGLEAIDLIEQALELREITVFFDEGHELAPNVNQAFVDPYELHERQRLRAWCTNFLRRGRHGRLSVYLASPAISGLHFEVWRFARATHYFRQSERADLAAIEERYGPGAAVQVARLRDQEKITVDKRAMPPGWDGNLQRLEQKARRLG